jgi:nicotinate-nucleotide adenylyltransferase
VRKIVPEGAKPAVNLAALAAKMAIRADQNRTAIAAGGVARAVGRAGSRLDRGGREAAGDRVAGALYPRPDPPRCHAAIMTDPSRRVEPVSAAPGVGRGARGWKANPFRRAPPRATAAAVTRTGLLGGSFNPAHRGHRRISAEALRRLDLDEIWWLVSPGNPLKRERDMAPFPARFASAQRAARRLPIRVSAIERDLGSVYTADTLRSLVRLFPRRRFIWLMGADNLASFHLWRDWRGIAATVPIAVIARPGYDGDAHAARAMGWLRRFVRPAAEARQWTRWRPPALVLIKLPLDPTSATSLRAARFPWHEAHDHSFNPQALRDGVTRRPIE